MKSFAAILLLAVAADARRSRKRQVVGAEMVYATCTDMSDDEMMKMRAYAMSWEADGSGDEIKPDRVAMKVDAAMVSIQGGAKGPADSTCYAFIESDCSAAAPAGYDSALADFDVNTNENGYAKFGLRTSDYVASDLIDGAMTLNFRDSAGDSMLCCVFEEKVDSRLLADQN